MGPGPTAKNALKLGVAGSSCCKFTAAVLVRAANDCVDWNSAIMNLIRAKKCWFAVLPRV